MQGKYSTSVIHETSLFTFNFQTDSHKVAQAALALFTAQAKRWTSYIPPQYQDLQAEVTRSVSGEIHLKVTGKNNLSHILTL